MLSVDELRDVGRAAGLDEVGVAAADDFEGTRTHLVERRDAGLHGGMQFTYRNPERSTTPSRILAGAQSLVVGARSYRRTPPDAPADPHALVARYAWEDYYGQLTVGLDAMADHLRAEGWQARVVVDSNALVDREAAYRAGLGWYGKNTNLLLPGHGSWFVLGSVVTDAKLSASEPLADGCGGCTRCLDGCPTNAIVAPGVLDARRCLAWLVQADGVFPVEFREALGGRIYGCDDCQEVCPPNRVEIRSKPPVEVGPGAEAFVPLIALLDATDEELMDRHGRWYIPRRDPSALRRNALVALGNVGSATDPEVSRVLIDALRHGAAIVRAHAVWACRRLGLEALLVELFDHEMPEVDPMVRTELERDSLETEQ